MINNHKTTVGRTAHYFTVGKVDKSVKYLWIVTHGYGELAHEFIAKFEGLANEDTLIIAPEGLNKFYWGGNFTGKPVATWMTSHVRLDEIADYANYLQKLYDQFVPQLADNVKINLLGFSQGTATQVRWIMEKFPAFHTLVLHSGLMPEDLDYRPHTKYFSDKKLIFVYGNQDRFVTESRIQWQKDFAREQGLELEIISFEGKHKVEPESVKILESKIRS